MLSNIIDLFKYKELLINFAVKELKIKYKNSVLGFFWSLLNPILMMLVFTMVFSVVFPQEIPYFPVFLLAGLLPWNFFNNTIMGGSTSVLANAGLVKKVYFPRELLPISIALANIVNFFLELLVFLVFIGILGAFVPKFLTVFKYLPFLLILLPILFLFSVGLGFLVASLNVYFRDIQHVISILMMVWFYTTPVLYNMDLVNQRLGKYAVFYKLNPMSTIILSFKNALYWMEVPALSWVIYSLLMSFLSFIIGYAVFLRLAPDFAEEL